MPEPSTPDNVIYPVSEAHAPALPTVSVFADCPRLRGAIAEDAVATGCRVICSDSSEALRSDSALVLGDVVIVESLLTDAAMLSCLARLDIHVANCGAQLVVGTSLDELDAVFGCFHQSDAQILVTPDRVQWIVAIGQALANLTGARIRELSDDERLLLLRLTEQVAALARRLDRQDIDTKPPRMADAVSVFRFPGSEPSPNRQHDPGFPDPAIIRQMIRNRRLRGKFFDPELFADPAWDMLLDLAAAHGEGKKVSVSSLCIASGVPPTTALRWIAQMTSAGLLEKIADQGDRRRYYIALSATAISGMKDFFTSVDLNYGVVV